MYNELLELWAKYEEATSVNTWSGTESSRKELVTLNDELFSIVQKLGQGIL